MKNKIGIHFILILLGASLWGTAGIFVRTAEAHGLSEMQLVLSRAFFSVIVLCAVLFIKDKKLFRVKLRDLWLFAAAGVMSIVLFNFCYYKTMALTSLSVAAVLLYTAPFFVVIMSPFVFKQRITIKKLFACIIAFVGCCFVTGAFGTGDRISASAAAFGILTGFGYSLYTVFSRLLLDRKYNSFTITFYTFLFAFIGCLPFADLKGAVNTVVDAPIVLLVAFLMAVFNTVIPYLLYTAGLNGVDTSAAPIIAMVEPVVATLVGTVLYSEPLGFTAVFGIILVFASVIILNLKDKNMKESLKIRANAKINLSLSVLFKREDGYHELDTVMQSISLYDTLYIKKSDNISVVCGEMSEEKNIAYKAARLFFEITGIIGGAEIIIEKNIPSPAGLGGGSADAAAVLRGLDRLYNTRLTDKELLDMAVRLGADVPFLVIGGTARARGIGEVIEPLKQCGDVTILIVKGENKLSTGEMFAKLDSTDYIKPNVEKTVNAINSEDYKSLILSFGNSFSSLWEKSIIKKRLESIDADAVSLSGSGPSYFAVFSEEEKAIKATQTLEAEGIECYLCKPADKSIIFE